MLKKHPKGLMILFMTEIWERFGFYIMSSIFVLYMQHDLNYDGTTRGILYAVFLGASYMFPIAGGFLGDRLYGQIRTIRYGAYLMAIGYIFFGLSSIDAQYLFYIGLAFVTFGTGIFKVNMSVLLGSMYKGNESRKDAGFNIYYMGVNIGATIGPFAANIIGYLTDNYNISFYAAAIGMVLSILIFEFNRKKLEEFDSKLKQIDEENNNIEIKTVSPDPQMDKAEFKDRIVTLIMLFLVASLFWVPFYQNGIGLTYFVDRSTVQHELLRPELYLAFNAIFIVILTPIMLAIFGKMREKGKEPATPNKIFIGLILMGSSMLIMVWASLEGGNLNQNIMSPLWVIMTYLIVTL
ncbi:peptide MFS transporter, partial [Bacteroidota bacterium]